MAGVLPGSTQSHGGRGTRRRRAPAMMTAMGLSGIHGIPLIVENTRQNGGAAAKVDDDGLRPRLISDFHAGLVSIAHSDGPRCPFYPMFL